ncbi:CDP-glycerol glycerophosphotransferase family protein [Bacillus suaedaesalsae]|uniref:CDP-glycerol glycerophosphotransferase family protein n=1 Tax=Bacillus suaedaesalsae TaxID=2810349 RepID=A0ABS2DKR0_9BACI|nr:CDP-glycerol glycerophosphotransferase family protein [Bacillus suaedaesalsae]MBM6619089.1 CDP-glycerol glycerophosphotransferase family protein [Bacillus suaedaesalsae]
MIRGLKSKIKNYLLRHTINEVNVTSTNINISVGKLRPFPLINRYVVFKDRQSGRRIEKKVNGQTASLQISELQDVSSMGTFDVYLKTFLLISNLKQRSKHRKKLIKNDYEDKSLKIKVIQTKNNNLSIKVDEILFHHKVVDLKALGGNVSIQGQLVANKNIVPDSFEIIFIRRDNKKSHSYRLDLKSLEHNVYEYFGILPIKKIRQDLVMNSRWDTVIQVRDEHHTVIQRELVNLNEYREFPREEQRYLFNIEDEENVLAFYATMGIQSLALWYTDKAQFEKTYNIAKGKSIFNDTCEDEPLDSKMVFFESFFGKNYSGSPKYIYEEMLRNEKFRDYTFVWSYIGNNPDEIPGDPILVDREREEYYRYLGKAKYWVNNILFPVHRKREGNQYLQTWHGTPLKKLGFDIEIEGPETLARENFYIESRNWDYLISANRYSSEIFGRAFKFDKEIIEKGYPLNDIFYANDLSEKIKTIKSKLNIPSDKKVILYAPTWRDNEMVGSWKHSFNLKFDLEQFYQHLKDDYVLILRMHHLVAESLHIDEKYESFVYELSKYDDIQELYVISDILITDYSSVFFDYANSRKPILFYAYDYDLYRENIRGFYLNMEQDLPGPIIKTSQDLLDSILHIENVSKQYQAKYEDFYNTYCYLDDGNASKRVIETVFD